MALDYTELFKQVKAEIASKRAELGECLSRVEALEDEISGLQQTAAGLAKTLGEQYEAEDELGLTEAIRRVFRQNPEKNFVPVEIRDELEQMGYNVEKYGNILASIHSVIKRLLDKDISQLGTRTNGKPCYQWKKPKPITTAPSPPHQV
jgi:archaellum component FlaC